jgi:shikimate 5-dehydrogenase
MSEFFSLSKYPGKTGEYFFNSMFKKFNMPHTYTALACDNIADGVKDMKERNASGFSVSMPYKVDVIQEIDFIENTVTRFNSCNTVFHNRDGWHGYNTDYFGAHHVLQQTPENSKVSILGDGAMGLMFKLILGNRAVVYSRKLGNWEQRYRADDIIVNCTSFGTATEDSPFSVLPPVKIIIDLAIKPNQLEQQAMTAGVKYIGGMEFYKRQFIRQFGIYTKKVITIEDVNSIC